MIELIHFVRMDTFYVDYKPLKWEVRWRNEETYWKITAYTPRREECDDTPFITHTGDSVRIGVVAADPSFLPLGTRIIIPGYNNDDTCVVLDTGSRILGNSLDVFMFDLADAREWGIKWKKIEILK